MSLLQRIYEVRLKNLMEEIRSNPEVDLTAKIQVFAADLTKKHNEREKRPIDKLLRELYGEDEQSLRRDLTKIKILNQAGDAPSAQRWVLFRCLCDALSLHTQEDFDYIMAECDRLEQTEQYQP